MSDVEALIEAIGRKKVEKSYRIVNVVEKAKAAAARERDAEIDRRVAARGVQAEADSRVAEAKARAGAPGVRRPPDVEDAEGGA